MSGRFGQKRLRPSKSDERRAYDAATKRDGNRCVKCGAHGIERDHRKNRSQGGWTTVANIQGLCPTCHVWKTQNPAEALALGFAVPSYARPELWPAWRINDGWVTYVDEPDEHGNWWRGISQFTADQLMNGSN